MTSSAPPPMTMTNGQLVKMAAPIILFSIILPTVDNVTDLRMIIRLYTGITGCASTYELPWQERYTCQEDPITYCKSNPNSTECSYFERYGDPFLIPGCKLIWQNEYTCQEDPATYCQSNADSYGCRRLKRYGYVSGIPGCKKIWQNDYTCQKDPATYCRSNADSYGCHRFMYGYVDGIPGCKEIWQNEYTCKEDPATYCQSNADSYECDRFERYGSPEDIPGCFNCYTDPAFFCEQKPDSPTCKTIRHTRFATMFLGKYLLFTFSKNFTLKTSFSSISTKLFCLLPHLVQTGTIQD